MSEFALRDIENSSVVRWPADRFSDGNIYAADSESNIDWSSLEAIGRNLTHGKVNNDFGEIDALLNMTTFVDSVSALFTNSSGDPINTTNFLVFKKTLYDVPITNSTNNTNFVTGITWDTSDDTNGEFDVGDKEDLVFLAEINKNKTGAYGVYDYEIRIPAKLREYYDANSREVVLYVELR
ncbi:hypothetical protein D6817_05280 [Candidatus Pacearchaeota archaeon]|nr:MAG: hypothetical protein D6817_05280 [Candidatus Pacearchaeota archaeon]